jgi:hypothetical protein
VAVGVGDDGERDGRVGYFVDIVDPLAVRGKVVGALGLLSVCVRPDCVFGGRTRPIICTSRASNSFFSFAKAPSSVVQTGVKSAGCEKRMVHLLSRNLWKSMSPWVVFA